MFKKNLFTDKMVLHYFSIQITVKPQTGFAKKLTLKGIVLPLKNAAIFIVKGIEIGKNSIYTWLDLSVMNHRAEKHDNW